jgi:hypothetical protein
VHGYGRNWEMKESRKKGRSEVRKEEIKELREK